MKFVHTKYYEYLANLAVFYFLVIALSWQGGYSLGALAILLVAIVFFIFNREKLKPSPRFLIYIFLIYFLARTISYAYYGFAESIQLDLALRFLLAIILVFFLAQKKLHFKFLLLGLTIGSAWAFWIGYNQINNGYYRALNFFNNPIMLGQTGVLWAMLSLAGLFLLEKLTPKLKFFLLFIYLAGFVFGLGIAVISGSKGAWIMVLPALGVFIISSWNYFKLKHLLVFLALLVFGLVWVIATDNIIKKRSLDAFAEISAYQKDNKAKFSSVGARLQMYKVASLMFLEEPIMGTGRLNRSQTIAELDIDERIKKNVAGYFRFHNDFFDIAAFNGLLVLIPFLLLLLIPAWFFGKHLLHKDKKIKYLATSGFLVVFCLSMAAMTETYFQSNSGVIIYSLLVAIFATQLWQKLHSKKQDQV